MLNLVHYIYHMSAICVCLANIARVICFIAPFFLATYVTGVVCFIAPFFIPLILLSIDMVVQFMQNQIDINVRPLENYG